MKKTEIQHQAKNWPFNGHSATFTCPFVDLAKRACADDLMKVKVSDLKVKLVGQGGSQLKNINFLWQTQNCPVLTHCLYCLG